MKLNFKYLFLFILFLISDSIFAQWINANFTAEDIGYKREMFDSTLLKNGNSEIQKKLHTGEFAEQSIH